MSKLLCMVLLILYSKNFCFGDDDTCQNITTVVDVSLSEMDGSTWYAIAYINETHNSEKGSCLKLEFKYNPENDTTTEFSSEIPHGSDQLEISIAELKMTSPGRIDSIRNNGSDLYYADFLEYTKGESFITYSCVLINGTKIIDRLSIFYSKRQVTKDQVLSKLDSIGINIGDEDEYYEYPQENCPD